MMTIHTPENSASATPLIQSGKAQWQADPVVVMRPVKQRMVCLQDLVHSVS